MLKIFCQHGDAIHGRPSTKWTSWKDNDMFYMFTIKSRLDAQFVKKVPLEMVIGQQIKEEGYDQNNGFYIKLSIHLLLK